MTFFINSAINQKDKLKKNKNLEKFQIDQEVPS